jgi:hypothetical protein
MKISLINESISNGIYFFKDKGRKTQRADRIITPYDGCEFIGDVGRTRDEVYEATSITIIYEGKKKDLSCKDIAPTLGRIKVCVRYGINNYDWKYLY